MGLTIGEKHEKNMGTKEKKEHKKRAEKSVSSHTPFSFVGLHFVLCTLQGGFFFWGVG